MLTWALPNGHAANFPMVLDEANRRVFIGTRKPFRLTVLDMDSGKVVASLPTGGDMDDMFYDAERKRIYVAGGEGFLRSTRTTTRTWANSRPHSAHVPAFGTGSATGSTLRLPPAASWAPACWFSRHKQTKCCPLRGSIP
jgi:hypothetical protein